MRTRRTPNEHEIRFLKALDAGTKLPVADLNGDRARQWCKKNGYAEFDRVMMTWFITSNGMSLLKGHER